MVPLPKCSDLLDLNRQLLEACARDDQRVPFGRTETKLVTWASEIAKLRPLPEQLFSTVDYIDGIRFDAKSRARVRSSRYSVPCRLAELLVRAEASSDRILIFHRREQVANVRLNRVAACSGGIGGAGGVAVDEQRQAL
jgi:hypothetical protein